MSSEALIDAFPPLYYAECVTGATVRGGHTINRATAANLAALGRPAKRAGPIQAQTVRLGTYTIGYVRSHASIKQLWVAWYYRPSTSPGANFVDLSLADALGNTIASSSVLVPIGFKGTASYGIPRTSYYQSDVFLGAAGYLDLDALAATLTDPSWSLTFDCDVSVLDRIEVWECPRSQVYDSETYGALTGPFNPGNGIVAGSVTTKGYERIAKTVEAAVACNRSYLNVAWPEDTAVAPTTASAAFTAFTRMLEGGTTPWAWRIRPRALYLPSSAAGEPARVRYRYQVTGGGTAAIRCSTGATASPYDLRSLTSATWAWSDWTAVEIPTNGTGRVATVTFEGKTTAGTLYVSAIQLEENQ